ncbi:OLD family endonuclease, partial [Vibrio anguillarum]|nr:OLD family endonuclease [Vibrio anguillarum]
MDKSYVTEDGSLSPSEALNSLSSDWTDSTKIEGDLVSIIEKWLNDHYQYVEEGNEVEENRHAELLDKIKENLKREEVLKILDQRVPVF